MLFVESPEQIQAAFRCGLREGLGFMVWGLWFGVYELGFRVWGLGFRVRGSDFMV